MTRSFVNIDMEGFWEGSRFYERWEETVRRCAPSS